MVKHTGVVSMRHRNGNREEKRGNQEGTKGTQRSMMGRVRQKDTTVGNSKQKWGGHQRASDWGGGVKDAPSSVRVGTCSVRASVL